MDNWTFGSANDLLQLQKNRRILNKIFGITASQNSGNE